MNTVTARDYFIKLETAIKTGDIDRVQRLLPHLSKYGKTEIRFFTRHLYRPKELFDDINHVYYSEAAFKALTRNKKIYVILLAEMPTAAAEQLAKLRVN